MLLRVGNVPDLTIFILLLLGLVGVMHVLRWGIPAGRHWLRQRWQQGHHSSIDHE